ncbi:hypothetical protein ZIOFF_043335 [Zingiber officinale]|uniref:Uncharacterized protein n=1 Tax=Zingiber officinale TaxID=94328 RepID=A0A8J5FV30_ZINOF|nr:hypothetical protein ZIOFF_043335 [Zingiber officinale]
MTAPALQVRVFAGAKAMVVLAGEVGMLEINEDDLKLEMIVHCAMSRCFPFSPTGYERKTNDHLDSQAEDADFGKLICLAVVVLTFNFQEKRKEKKRKKEKREGKDRYKEKKDQKETHKDYKKKDRKDRSSIRNGRPDKQSQSPDGNLLGENNHKPKQINHFKDFDWGIKDEQKVAANRKDDNFKFPAHKSIRSLAAATAMVKESVASHRTFPSSSEEINQSKFKVLDREIKDDSKTEENQKVRNFNIPVQKSVGTMDKKRSADHKAFPSSAVAPQRQIGSMERPADNFHNSTPRRNEGMVSKSEIQKEKNAMEKLVSMLISTRQRGNGGVSLLMENLDGSIHRRFKGSSPATSVEIDDCNNNKVAIISNNSVQRTINGMGHSANRLSVHKNVNSSFPVKIEDRANKDRMVARNDGMGGLVEKDANNGIQEGKSKNKEREACGKREEKYKNQDLDKKDKDKDKHKGKEKEKVKVKKDKEQKEPRDDRKKNQLDALRLKPLASQINNAKNNIIDENIKKRKEIEKNSFHNDTNFRPNKTQNTNFSTPLCEENGTLESSDIVFPRLKPEAIGNKLSLKAIDQEECIKNSITKTQSSSALSMYPVAAKTDMTKVGATPHPDCVYLDRLYTIPKVDGYPEYDDQEWVFSSCHDRKSNSKLQANANEVPQCLARKILHFLTSTQQFAAGKGDVFTSPEIYHGRPEQLCDLNWNQGVDATGVRRVNRCWWESRFTIVSWETGNPRKPRSTAGGGANLSSLDMSTSPDGPLGQCSAYLLRPIGLTLGLSASLPTSHLACLLAHRPLARSDALFEEDETSTKRCRWMVKKKSETELVKPKEQQSDGNCTQNQGKSNNSKSLELERITSMSGQEEAKQQTVIALLRWYEEATISIFSVNRHIVSFRASTH